MRLYCVQLSTTNFCVKFKMSQRLWKSGKTLLKNAMESAEAKWLGDIPAVADVKVGRTWQECH